MIAETGHFALLLALALALGQSVLGLVGPLRRDLSWMESAARAAIAQAATLVVAFLALTIAYVTSDFSVENVYLNSHADKPLLYRITGVWGNHEGSMLLWSLTLAVFGAAVALGGRNLTATLQARVLGIQGLIGVAFLAFTAFTSNPFRRLDPAPLSGQDLNPLLQDPGLAFHPPLLYAGYVGLSVTFAFAVAALIEGRVDAAWARWVRPWTLLSWSALTMGIALGSWWAYYELGWGGWWFWDPVENASFMPWLVATALLHSAMVVERRETLKAWTILLAILAFSLSLLGTFIVRSGVLTSVHAFASDPARGVFILAILVVAIGGALVLFAWRAPVLKGGAPFAPVSRETALLMNNIVLTVACAAVLIGTLYPIFAKELIGETYSVGPPYFNFVMGALLGPLMLLTPMGPLMAWKRADATAVLVRLAWAAGLSLVAIILTVSFFVREPISALLGVGLGVWLILGAMADLMHKARFGAVAPRVAWARLTGLPRAQVGTALAHAGTGIFILGAVATSVWHTEQVMKMKTGETVEVAGYELRFEELVRERGPNFMAEGGVFTVSRDGELVARMAPEKRFYPVAGMPTTEAAIQTNGIRDLYLVLGERHEDESRTVRFHVNPLAPWIWGGAVIMALGGLVSLSDRRYRIGAPGLKRKGARADAPAAAE